MRDVAQSAEIVSKFSNVSNEFKNGNWIETFATSPIQDPVAYAAHHNIQIEGQNALEWAYNNSYKVKHSSARISETTTEKQWKKDGDGKWHEQESEVTRNRMTKQEMDPIEYIAAIKLSKKEPLSKSEEEFITQAMALNLTNASGKSVKSMLGNFDLKKTTKPAIATIQSQDKDTTNSLVKLVDNFVQETTGTKVTTEKAIEFYDKVLSTLEEQKYLTKQDVANIKKDPDYITQAEKTAKLMETQTSKLDLKGVDKMYYQLARFTQAIRLPKISKYFTESITTEKVKRINVIEAALSHSIKVSTTVSGKSKPVLQTKRLENVSTQVKKKLGSNAER